MGNDPLGRDSNLPGVSSTSVVNDGVTDIAGDNIHIPNFYWKNRVALLPVNASRQFVYWELTEEFLQKKLQRVDDDFILKVIDDNNEVMRINIQSRNGEHYIDYTHPFANLEVELLSKDGQTLVKSNRIVLGSNKLHQPDKETWMTKERGEMITKECSKTLAHQNVLNSGEMSLDSPDSKEVKVWQSKKVSSRDLFSKNSINENLSSHTLGDKS